MNGLPPGSSSLACPGVIIKSHTVVAAAAQSSHIPFIKREDEEEDDDDRPDDAQRRHHQHHHAGTPGGRTSSSSLSAAENSTHSATTTTTDTNTAAASPEDGSRGSKYGAEGMSGGEMGDGENDLLQEEKPIRRKRRVKGQKICGVCGDLAQSHNFGALSCETCKAFFRRNALRQKELLTCVFNSSCTITKETRRFCAPCRLKKCYAVGMDSDLILDSDERQERQRKRTMTAIRKRLTLEQAEAVSPNTSTLTARPPPIDSQPDKIGDESTAEEEGKDPVVVAPLAQAGSKSSPSPNPTASSSSSAMHATSSSSSRTALGVHFEHAHPDDLPEDPAMYYPLSSDESTLLDHLTVQYRNIFWARTASSSSGESLKLSNLPVEKVMVAVDHLFRKFISFSKKVSEFNQLTEADQVTLLKSTAMRLYCVRLGEAYIPDKSAWYTGIGQVSETEVAHLFKEPLILSKIVDFCRGFKFVLGQETTLDALAHVLVLFDPRDPKLENRALVSRFKDRYLVLLKRHLEARLSFLHVDRYLAEILRILMDIDLLGQALEDFFSDYSSHFYPLVTEFLNQ